MKNLVLSSELNYEGWITTVKFLFPSLSHRRSTTVSLETRKPVAVMIWANSIKYHPV